MSETVKRVFLLVLDSFGIGAVPDAGAYGDEGSDTFGAVAGHPLFSVPHLRELGLYNIADVTPPGAVPHPAGSFARLRELSRGKDTTTGHWEIAGLVLERPFPTYPDGFPPEVTDAFEAAVGRGILCNRPYSGTQVIADYGEEHLRTGKLIVYTSADSVFQIAAHESLVEPEELYRICRTARGILKGEHAVGRVIARPFTGEPGHFTRTPRRHDFSLEPIGETMLDLLSGAGRETIGVGKIGDIFAGRGLSSSTPTTSNRDGMRVTLDIQRKHFTGLCFVNLVDFDMLYGHRNDTAGYARALGEFDCMLGAFLCGMREGDVLILTADHGCDPSTPSTDHSREAVPMIAYGAPIRAGVNLGVRDGFCDIGATVLDLLGVPGGTQGRSFAHDILRCIRG